MATPTVTPSETPTPMGLGIAPNLDDSPVPVTPEMQGILQTLANSVVSTRRAASAADSQFQNYITQCAQLLNLDPSLYIFDPAAAAFIKDEKIP